MEKDNVNRLTDRTLTKDGIHILFGFNTTSRFVHTELRKNILDKIEDEDFELPLINNWESVDDEGIMSGTTNVQLFGSRKPSNEPYKLTSIWNMELDTNDNDDDDGRGV